MSKDQNSMSEELFKLDGKPSTSQALPLALQHVVAMVVGCVAPAIIISGVAGLSASDSVILIQAALTMSAISTLFQVFPLLRGKKLAIGAGLPLSWVLVLPIYLLCRQLLVNLILQLF